MCVATLHVSTQPCAHRWYQLVRPCSPANNLQNCPEKLKLEGWEVRSPNCPRCNPEGSPERNGTYRLLGTGGSDSSTPSSPTLSDLDSLTPRRVDSLPPLSALPSLSRHTTASSTESEAGQRHRAMNSRLHAYLTTHPHELLPSAAKNYPTYPQAETQGSASDEAPTARKAGREIARRFKKRLRLSISSKKV